MNQLLLKIIICYLLFSTATFAKVGFQYTGIAGIHITDGQTSLFFDPVFSRPNFIEVLLGLEYDIDNKKIHRELSKLNIKKLDAIFIGHTHQDHALDMHVVQKKVGGTIYGSRSTINIALSLGVSSQKVNLFNDEKEYKIGKFTIKVLKSAHGKIFGIYEFRDGEILKPLNRKLTLSDYVMGGSYSFYIIHPEGEYLIHQSSRPTPNVTKLMKGKSLKAIFQGVANRKSAKHLFDEIIKIPQSVEYVIPIHHDNFFLEMNEEKMDYLWFVDLPEFLDESKKQSQKIILPEYRQFYNL